MRSPADQVVLSSRVPNACWEFAKATQESGHRTFKTALLQADFGTHCVNMLQRTFDHEVHRRDCLMDVLLASPEQLADTASETNKNTLRLCDALSSVKDILTFVCTRQPNMERVHKLRNSVLLSGASSESDSASQWSSPSRGMLQMMRRSLACLVSGWSMHTR